MQDLEAGLDARRAGRRGRGARRRRYRRRCATGSMCRTLATPSTTSMSSGRPPGDGRRSPPPSAGAVRRPPSITAPRISPLRLPPVPGPYGVSLVSPWSTVTSANRLRGTRTVSCAVMVSSPWPWARSRGTRRRPFGLDTDVHQLVAIRTEHALRLDVQTGADAEEFGHRLELLPFRTAEVVVVERLGGPLQVLSGRDVDHRVPHGACRASHGAAARSAAELDGSMPSCRARRVERLLGEANPISHGPRYRATSARVVERRLRLEREQRDTVRPGY